MSTPPAASGRKRCRSPVPSCKTPDLITPLPVLPRITGDIILDVFTHRSLYNAGTQSCSSPFGGSERLSELGRCVLEVIVTDVLFHKAPFLKGEEIAAMRTRILSDTNVEKWTTEYQLKQKLCCHPSAVASLQAPEETRILFFSYFGAVYTEAKCFEDGIKTIRKWTELLVDWGTLHTNSASSYACPSPPLKKIKHEVEQLPLIFPPPLPPPSEAPVMPIPTQPPNPPNPLAPAQPHLPFLPLFNQAAEKRRAVVEYTYEASGPSHERLWTVTCFVNQIQKGVGCGTNKRLAREDAARQAFFALGWAPHS